MKTPSLLQSFIPCVFRQRLPLVIGLALVSVSLPATGQVYWQGADGTGGDGVWTSGNFTEAPTSDKDVVFTGAGPYSSPTAVVTMAENAVLRARYLYIENGKSVTFNMAKGANLTLPFSRFIGPGGAKARVPAANTTSLVFNGPAEGVAQVVAGRLYSTDADANVTGDGPFVHRTSSVFNGAGLELTLNGSFSHIGNRSDVLFDGGVTVLTQSYASRNANAVNRAGAFHIRTGSLGSEPFDNWMTVRHATITLHLVSVQGLFQVGKQATLIAASPNLQDTEEVESLTFNVGTGAVRGRMEVEGTGIDHRAVFNVAQNAVLAIGVSDPGTLISSQAETFTLNQTLNFAAGGTLEFDLFSGSGDLLIVGAGGSLASSGAGVVLALNLNGYAPLAGQSWQLIDTSNAGSHWLAGNFNLSGLDTDLWDLSSFNEAGGWRVVAIPEPSSVAVLVLSSIGLALWRQRRRRFI